MPNVLIVIEFLGIAHWLQFPRWPTWPLSPYLFVLRALNSRTFGLIREWVTRVHFEWQLSNAAKDRKPRHGAGRIHRGQGVGPSVSAGLRGPILEFPQRTCHQYPVLATLRRPNARSAAPGQPRPEGKSVYRNPACLPRMPQTRSLTYGNTLV